MNKHIIAVAILLISMSFSVSGQDTVKEEGYLFTVIKENAASPVKDQHKSGTCWSFAATSFIESELLRAGNDTLDLSEMFFVHHAYTDKANRFVRLHGSANFGPGGQAHDVLNIVKKYGFATETTYPGLIRGEEKHKHSELDKTLKAYLDAVIDNKEGKLSQVWPDAFEAILSAYLTPLPTHLTLGGKEVTPIEFAKNSGFDPDDYIELTSYSHHPFYSKFELEIPDNWSHDLYYNVPADELIEVMNYAIEKGFTVCWDGDVSDKGFSHSNGVAVIPEKELSGMDGTERSRWEKLTDREKNAELYSFKSPGTEKKISAAMRQEAFDSYQATDDHLMHITGLVKDQNGTLYYKTKNSWAGDSNKSGGYLNMSEAYVKLNTTAILIHRNALPAGIKKKLGI